MQYITIIFYINIFEFLILSNHKYTNIFNYYHIQTKFIKSCLKTSRRNTLLIQN